MNLLQSKKPSRAYAIAFGLPVVSILILQLIAGSEPFGNSTSMLYSDMYHQYYPFFLEFRRALRSGDSLLYNWSVGMGMDYLALISYYLASPLNLLTVLLPENWMLEYFSLLMPLKLGLASLFFSIFLHKTTGDSDEMVGIFGCFYGLCAWALGYQWNVMWLDTFALLPLTALGTVALLRDKKFILYSLTLFLSIFANYYIGLFTCIFTLLLFFAYEICCWKGFKRFCADFVRIGCFTVLAIGMTAVLELPALAGLQNTQSSVNNFPTTFRLNIVSEHNLRGLLDAMRQVAGNMLGGLTPTFKEGLPNLYCGVGSLVLAFLYLTCRDVKVREKLCGILMLLFFMLSFIIRQLDYIWHGMHFTNMIPYRFSFLFSFVILCMAYGAWRRRKSFNVWNLVFAGLGTVLLIVLSEGWRDLMDDGADQLDAWLFLAYNVGFLVLYLAALGYGLVHSAGKRSAGPDDTDPLPTEEPVLSVDNARRSRLAVLSMAGILVLEIAMNVLNFGLRFSYTTVSNYPRGTKDTEAVIAYMKDHAGSDPFYRTEVTHSQTLNDGALNDYNGISTFTSSANVRVTEFMKALGYGAKNTYNRYCFEESSPVANLFLNLRYMIERDGDLEDNAYFDTLFTSGSVTLMENNARLPLGFMTRPELANLDFDRTDHFRFQNDLFTAATGISEEVWNLANDVAITAENVTLDSTGGFKCSYSGAESSAYITYTFSVMRNGFFCIDLDVTDRNSYEVFRNGERLYSEKLSLPQMIAVSDVQAGDHVSVKLKCKSGEEGRMTVGAAILDASIFRSGLEILRQAPLELSHFSNTRIEGSVNCPNPGLLYTSVPDDGNWVVFVDGQAVEHERVGGAMIGVMLEKGFHDIRMEYHNQAFSYGWKISLMCALILLICRLLPRERKVGKFQRRT